MSSGKILVIGDATSYGIGHTDAVVAPPEKATIQHMLWKVKCGGDVDTIHYYSPRDGSAPSHWHDNVEIANILELYKPSTFVWNFRVEESQDILVRPHTSLTVRHRPSGTFVAITMSSPDPADSEREIVDIVVPEA